MHFPLLERHGDPAALVVPPPAAGRQAVLVVPDRAAVLLGSTQSDGALDATACADAGLTVARRASGGGAVVVAPDAQVWLDVFVPSDDAAFERDVSLASRRLGELWRAALVTAGVELAMQVHTGGRERGEFAATACFTSLGPGEVTSGGRKLVGISQRRTRAGAWLHSMALLEDHQRRLPELLALDDAARTRLAQALAERVGVVELSGEALAEALAAHLA